MKKEKYVLYTAWEKHLVNNNIACWDYKTDNGIS